MTIKIELTQETFLLLEEFGDEPEEAIRRMYYLLSPKAEDFSIRVENYYKSMVSPYVEWEPPRPGSACYALMFGIGSKKKYRNHHFWVYAFSKLQKLRGLLASKASTLNGLIRVRGDRPPVILWVASGRYDTWTKPKTNGKVTLEQVLFEGAEPGDWLNPPLPSDPETVTKHLKPAQERYLNLMPKHVIRWVEDFGLDEEEEYNHFGLLNGLTKKARKD